MDLLIKEVAQSLGTSVVLIWALWYFGGKLMDMLTKRDLEQVKSELKRTAEREIEEFKHALEIQAKESEIRFSNMHGRRLDVMLDVFQKVVNVQSKLAAYTAAFVPAGAPPEAERQKIAVDALNEFLPAFNKNRPLLSVNECKLLDVFKAEAITVYNQFVWKDLDRAERIKQWNEVNERFEKKCTAAADALEKSFREYIGVKD